jgi:drug/metabolite transporter (DMT)-like permease
MTAWLSYLSIVLMWGSAYFAVVISFESFTPFGCLAIRFLAAALLSIVVGVVRRESWPAKSEWRILAVVGVVMLGGANMLTTWAVQFVPSGLVAVFMSLVPMWIIVFSLRQTAPTLKVWLGLALGVVGVWLLLQPGAIDNHDVGALFAMFLAPAVWAFGTVYAKRSITGNSNFTQLGIQLGFAAFISFAVLPFFGDVLIAPLTVSSIAAVAYLALVASFLAYGAYFYLLRIWPAHRVGTFAYLTPLVAVMLGTLILNEPLTIRELIGMATVLLAVALTLTKGSSHETEKIIR